MALLIDACIAQHQGDRKEQQDRVALFPHPKGGGILLAIVADGMGGHAGGSLAAEQVLYTVRSNFNDFVPTAESSRAMLESSLREAHTLIKASRFINEKDPHSTAVSIVLQPGKIGWAHCGDSRLYRFRGKQLIARSIDHSYVEHLIAIAMHTCVNLEWLGTGRGNPLAANEPIAIDDSDDRAMDALEAQCLRALRRIPRRLREHTVAVIAAAAH